MASRARHPVDPVPPGRVIDRHPEHGLGVDVAADRDDLADRRPVDHFTAGNPPRADHHVGAFGGGQHGRQVLGTMRAVGVHLHHGVIALVLGPRETVQVGGSQTGLGLAVHHVDLRVLRRDGVSDLTGPIGRVVVEDHHIDMRSMPTDPLDDAGHVLALVVRRDEHGDPLQRWT
jgi:hypothetical protein